MRRLVVLVVCGIMLSATPIPMLICAICIKL